MIIKSLLLSHAFFLLSFCLTGQDYTVKNYTDDDELPYSNVKNIVQADNGYFFIASETQISRFDGTQFHKIPFSLHLINDKIVSLHSAGKFLFVQTLFGFYILDNTYNQRFVAVTEAEKAFPLILNVINQNEVILANNKRIFTFHGGKSGGEKLFRLNDPISDIQFYNENYIILSNGSLFLADTLGTATEPLFTSNEFYIKKFATDSKFGIVYLTDGLTISQLFLHGKVLVPLKNGKQISGTVNNLQLYDSNLHISTSTGFYLYDAESGQLNNKTSIENGLNSNNVYKSVQSKFEPVIMMLTDGGLSKLSKAYFTQQVIFDLNSDSPIIKSRYNLNDSEVLIGTTDGLFLYNQKLKKTIRKLSPLIIQRILKRKNQLVLIDSKYNLLEFDYAYRLKNIGSVLQNASGDIIDCRVLADDRIIIVTNDLFTVLESDNEIRTEPLKFSINAISEYRGLLFASSGVKLVQIQLQPADQPLLISTLVFETLYQFETDNITALFSDKDNLWFAASDQIYLLNYFDRQVIKLNDHGFSGNVVRKIFKDNLDRIWVLSNSGLNLWNGKSFVSYGKLQGIPSLTILPEHIIQNANGEIELTAQKRLIWFKPESTDVTTSVHRVSIDRIYIYDRQLTVEDKLYISHDDNYLRFEFSIPSYVAPQLTSYQYRMLGIDTSWISTEKETSVSFTFLKPGTYRFQIKGFVWGSESETEIASQTIIITPPWWQTVWFKIFLPLVVIFILIFLINYRFKHKQNQIDILEEEVKKRTAELERLARIDGLTKLYNRRTFDEMLDAEYERSVRFNHSLSLAFIDIDFFKKINDKYLHHTGDVVLAVLGEQMQMLVRSVDVVSRYGGEEFCIIFPYTDSSEAYEISERLRKTIEDYPWESVAPGLKVTISIGISSYPDQVKTKNQLMEVADKNLYKAKNNGRNQTIR